MSFLRKTETKQIEANRLHFSVFDNVMDNPDAFQIFREFLEKQHNSEQILFLNKIKKIEEEHEYAVQRGLGRYTIQSYLAENSQFELNVSQQLKEVAIKWVQNVVEDKEFLTSEEEKVKQKQLIGLFEKLKKEIRFQLAVECFPQFLDSTTFKDFCAQYKPKPQISIPSSPSNSSTEVKSFSPSSSFSKLSILLKKQKSKSSSESSSGSSTPTATTRSRTQSAAAPILPHFATENRRRSLNDVEAIKTKRSSFESIYKQARNSGGSVTEVANPLIASFDVSFVFQKSIKDWTTLEVATWVDSTTALSAGSKKHMIDLELKGTDLLLLDDSFLERCLGVRSKEERTNFLKEILSVSQLRSNRTLGFE